MGRKRLGVIALFAIVVSALGFAFSPPIANAANSVGAFEIDGNKADNSGVGDPIDWDSPAPNLTTFSDPTGRSDDSFTQGSEELAPGSWICAQGSVPGKDDILNGAVSFRNHSGDQFVYVNYQRAATSGDAHIDYEFNQSDESNASCPQMPKRTDGDIVITFDTENGGKTIFVRAFRWNGDAVSGTFDELPTGSKGSTFDGAVNLPTSTIPGVKAGAFGEAALNLTDTIGAVECGKFASVAMKTRASTSINSALKDRTLRQPVKLAECPDSKITKSVRNLTTSGTFGPTATAAPGQTLEYRLVYVNAGAAPATNVSIEDVVEGGQTLVSDSCSPACSVSGSTLTWDLGTISNQAPNNTATVTFQVKLDSTFPAGTTTVKNTAVVTTTEEKTPKTSTTETKVTAEAKFSVVKDADKSDANPGDLVTYSIEVTNTGSAAGTHAFTDDFDDRVTNLSAVTSTPGGGSCGNAAGQLSCTTSTIQPGESQTFTYSANMPTSFSGPGGGNGCASDKYPVRNVIVGGDHHTVCVRPTPSFTVNKTADPTTAVPGQTVTYTVVVTNGGSGPGTHSFTDDYDDRVTNLSPVSTTPTGGSCTKETGQLACTTSALDPGATQTFTYTAKMPATFSGQPGGHGCPDDDYPVRNVIVGGDDAVVCVDAKAVFVTIKTPSKATAEPGETITYTIAVTNSGTAAGTHTFEDDFDDRVTDLSAVTSVPSGGSCSPAQVLGSNGLRCTTSELAAGATQTFTYSAKMPTIFTTTPGLPPCGAQEHLVRNVIVGGDGADVCVKAPAVLTISKTACPANAVPGGVLTYTIDFGNSGQTAATGVVVTDSWPAGTDIEVVDADGGTVGTNSISWTIGNLAPGATGSRTVKVLVGEPNGSVLQDTATVTAAGGVQAATTGTVSVPVSNAGALTHGSAYGADATVLTLELINELGRVDTVAPGTPGQKQDELIVLPVPPLVSLGVIRNASDSAVSDEATSTSTATVASVNLLAGAITADAVRGVATADADAAFATTSSAGSTFADLRINGSSVTNVAPNTKLKVRNPLVPTQTIAEVVLHEEIKTASVVDGKYRSTLEVNMIHVTLLRSFLTLPKGAEIIVAHAASDAAFPTGLACGDRPAFVGADAYNAWVEGTLPAGTQLAEVQVGDAAITPLGGDDVDVADVLVPGAVTAHSVVNEAHGSIAGLPSAWARSRVEDANVLGGLITADVLDVRSSSTCSTSTATSGFATTFADVRIGSLPPLALTPSVNSTYLLTLPTGGFAQIVVNEQVSSNGANDSMGTVNALHVYLYSGLGVLTGEVIVAHAHSEVHRAA